MQHVYTYTDKQWVKVFWQPSNAYMCVALQRYGDQEFWQCQKCIHVYKSAITGKFHEMVQSTLADATLWVPFWCKWKWNLPGHCPTSCPTVAQMDDKGTEKQLQVTFTFTWQGPLAVVWIMFVHEEQRCDVGSTAKLRRSGWIIKSAMRMMRSLFISHSLFNSIQFNFIHIVPNHNRVLSGEFQLNFGIF